MTAEKGNLSEKEKELLEKIIPKMRSTLQEFIDESDGTEKEIFTALVSALTYQLTKIARSLCMGNDAHFQKSIEALGEDVKSAVRKYYLLANKENK